MYRHLCFIRNTFNILAPVSIRAPLQFQHSSIVNNDDNRKDVEKKLVEICDTTLNGVTTETPKLFTSLVLSMKNIGSKDMDIVYKKIKDQSICAANNNRVG